MFINAKDYNKFFYKDNFYFLLNLDNKQIEYLIKWIPNKIQFLKIVQLQKIINLPQYNKQNVYKYLYDNFDYIKQDKRIVKRYCVFNNIDEVVKYLQQIQQVDTEDIQNIFQIDIQKKIIKNNGIDIQIECDINKKQLQYYLNKIDQIIKKSKTVFKSFKNVKIILKNNIIQSDSHDIGGNYIRNKNGYNAVITVILRNLQFNLWHQLGHYYKDLYIDSNQHEQLYLYVLQHNQIFNSRDDVIFIQEQCVPQLFALYYTNQLNTQAKKFVQEKILK